MASAFVVCDTPAMLARVPLRPAETGAAIREGDGLLAEAVFLVSRQAAVGKRLLDGRQVAILTRCSAGDDDGALAMLDDGTALRQWEAAVAACLRALCHKMSNRPADSHVAAMVRECLGLEPAPGRTVFRVRLGLCVVDLLAGTGAAGVSQVAGVVIREARTAADAYAAWDVLSHETCRSQMSPAGEASLVNVVEVSGLEQGRIPARVLDDLMESVETSEAELAAALSS
jgi:hypothetical protein